jgi:uncharacterized NAD-dependent epimerase/dehydratase family protein
MRGSILEVSSAGLRFAVLVEGSGDRQDPKTAVGLARYRPEQVAALIDPGRAGSRVDEVLPLDGEFPVVADLDEARKHGANALLVGIAPVGGRLPGSWRKYVLQSLSSGWPVWSGLHTLLADDPEIAAASRASGTPLVDLRWVPEDLPVGAGRVMDVPAHVVLTVGSDCAVGKMTVSWEITEELTRRGERAAFVATGQTGILLSGWGLAVDRVRSDFVAGATEELVREGAERGDWVIVEGQGSLVHPGFSAVTLGLIHGAVPRSLILCHQAARTHIRHYGGALPSLERLVALYEEAAEWVRPAPVVGIAANTYGLDELAIERMLEEMRAGAGLPVGDVVRDGPAVLVDALLAAEKLRGGVRT